MAHTSKATIINLQRNMGSATSQVFPIIRAAMKRREPRKTGSDPNIALFSLQTTRKWEKLATKPRRDACGAIGRWSEFYLKVQATETDGLA